MQKTRLETRGGQMAGGQGQIIVWGPGADQCQDVRGRPMAGAASENDKGAAKGLTGKGKSDAAAVRKTHSPRTKRRKNRLWYERRTHPVPNTGTTDGGTKNGLTPYQTREQATAVRKTTSPRTKLGNNRQRYEKRPHPVPNADNTRCVRTKQARAALRKNSPEARGRSLPGGQERTNVSVSTETS